MTTTNTFQGMDDATKPSSRVLRPPGGGSSNIFGGPEPSAPSPSKPYKRSNILGGDSDSASTQQTPPNKSGESSKDRIFGDAPSKDSPKSNNAKGQDGASPSLDDKDSSPRAAAETKPQPAYTPPTIMYRGSTAPKPQQRGAYNPITGEAYNTTPDERTSSRVRQPPGGASSGIF